MDRADLFERLEQARRHVEQGEQHVARQRELVGQLHQDGHNTDDAIRLLGQFQELLTMHRQDRDRLEAELNENSD